MLKKLTKNNYLFLLFFLTVFAVVFWVFNGSVIHSDELYWHFFNEQTGELFPTFYFGTWLMHFMNFFFIYIPSKLNINIQDYCSVSIAFFKALFITGLFYAYYKLAALNKYSHVLLFSVLLMNTALFLFYAAELSFGAELKYIVGFFRYIPPAFLSVIMSYYFLKYLKDASCSHYLLCSLAFLTSTSSEMVAGIMLITFFLYTIYSFFRDKSVFILCIKIVCSLFAGVLLLSSSPGFKEHSMGRYSYFISVPDIIANLSEFTKEWFSYTIWNFRILLIIFICLLTINIIKKTKISFIVFALFLLTGLYAEFYAFIIPGDTYYYGGFWLQHMPVYIIFYCIYLIAIIVLFASVAENIKRPATFIISSILIISALFMMYFSFKNIKYIRNYEINIRNHSYMRDKIRMFWYYADRYPVVPVFVLHSVPMDGNEIKDVNSDKIYYATAWKDRDLYLMERYYFGYVYNQPVKNMFDYKEITPDNASAIKRFEACGGTIDEIYTGKYKFSNLSNKDFVLNNYDKYKDTCTQPVVDEYVEPAWNDGIYEIPLTTPKLTVKWY